MSEKVELLQSMRDVLDLHGELSEVMSSDDSRPKIHCTIFEDNKGSIDLVSEPR